MGNNEKFATCDRPNFPEPLPQISRAMPIGFSYVIVFAAGQKNKKDPRTVF
jgi:hypothetical protein